ncbi:MAG: protein phosphatase 2C domain-containing protein, partial [Variovorax sp.]
MPRQIRSAILRKPALPALAWQFAALSDVGRNRSNNEDAVAYDAELMLALLADGLGGYNGGEVASNLSLAVLRQSFVDWRAAAGAAPSNRSVRRALQAGVDDANHAILAAAAADPQLHGMGTTLVVAAFAGHSAIVGHIGDSRCYRLRERQLLALTDDHSMLRELLAAGSITPEQAEASPYRNLVTRALGVDKRIELELHEHDAADGDLFLLCSDGLSTMLDDAQILTILLEEG